MGKGDRVADKPGTGDDVGGKSLSQLMAERMAESRFTEMMASAGVDNRRMSLEVLYYLPRDFLDAYAELWHRALGPDDSGVDARGGQQQDVAVSGKAQVKSRENARGESYIREATSPKRFKKYWLVRDGDALELKGRLDRRLRALAREIREEIGRSEQAAREESSESQGDGTGTRAHCAGCGRLMRGDWAFCPGCGTSARETG